jgi:hypothetical protein
MMFKTERANQIYRQVENIMNKLDADDAKSVGWTIQIAKLLRQYDARKIVLEETIQTLADSRVKGLTYNEKFLTLSNECSKLEEMLLTSLEDGAALSAQVFKLEAEITTLDDAQDDTCSTAEVSCDAYQDHDCCS